MAKDDPYQELRPLMFSIAYRMLGSVSEAEDIVQEAFLRLHVSSSDGAEIRSPKAFLSAVTTRLCIDHLRSARVRRESYVGSWIPEPLMTEEVPHAGRHAETADSLSLAFLVLLESLTPVERAVFLLREVFDYGYGEIATILGKNEDNCRQLAVRARRHVEARRPRFEASRGRRDELARRFFAAVEEGDTEGLVGLLAADAVAYSDGGGLALAFPRPVHGREHVMRLLLGVRKRVVTLGLRRKPAEINGQPGALFVDSEGGLVVVVSLDIGDSVQTVRAISNPEKLSHLGPVSHVLVRGLIVNE